MPIAILYDSVKNRVEIDENLWLWGGDEVFIIKWIKCVFDGLF